MATSLRSAPAYDYERQCWVDAGPEAVALHRAHLTQERELVASEQGEDYLQSMGSNMSVGDVLAMIDAKLAELVA